MQLFFGNILCPFENKCGILGKNISPKKIFGAGATLGMMTCGWYDGPIVRRVQCPFQNRFTFVNSSKTKGAAELGAWGVASENLKINWFYRFQKKL